MAETTHVSGTPGGEMTDRPRLRHRPLAEHDAARLHDRALTVLAGDGVPIAGELALRLLDEAGARVDRAAGRAWLPAELVGGAVAKAPATFVLSGRAPGNDVLVGGGPGGLLAAMAAAPDLGAACLLADALPEVAAVGLPDRPPGRPGRGRGRHEQADPRLRGSVGRAGRGADRGRRGARRARRRPALGRSGRAQRRPDRSRPAARLRARRAGVRLADAARGLQWRPLGRRRRRDRRLPRRRPGGLHAAAARRAGLVLLRPGAARGRRAPCARLGRRSRLAGRLRGAGPARGACRPARVDGLPADRPAADDWRAAEAGVFAALAAALGGAALVAGAGHTDHGTRYSPEQLVLDAETWSNVAFVGAGIVVDDETIALDTIAAVGIGGNALGQRHTRRHMKDVWRPRLFDRGAYEAWDREGRKSARDRAAALAGELVAGHDVPPPDPEKLETLRRIIATAGL